MRRVLLLTLCLGTLAATAGCSKGSPETLPSGRRIENLPSDTVPGGEPQRSERVLEVVATSSVVADWLRVVGSTNVHTTVMVRSGIDPVSYLPTAADVDALQRADLVVAVGRGLEPWLDGIRQQAAGRATVVTLSDGLPARTTPSGAADPFAWLDLGNAKQMVAALAAALATADPVDQAPFFAARDAYVADLDRLDQDLRRVLGPVAGRGLVTAKETFGWFAARYGLEVVGSVLPSLDSLSDPPPQHLALLRQTVQARQVKAAFAEATVPDTAVRALARDTGIKAVVGSDALLGDGLGPAGTGTDTFLGALRHNGRVLAANLT